MVARCAGCAGDFCPVADEWEQGWSGAESLGKGSGAQKVVKGLGKGLGKLRVLSI